MFKKIAASSARFNLRQSIKRLNDFIDIEEILISDDGKCSPNNEPFMRSVILDFKYFMEYCGSLKIFFRGLDAYLGFEK